MEKKQVLPLQVRLDLKIISMNRYSTLNKYLKLKPRYQMSHPGHPSRVGSYPPPTYTHYRGYSQLILSPSRSLRHIMSSLRDFLFFLLMCLLLVTRKMLHCAQQRRGYLMERRNEQDVGSPTSFKWFLTIINFLKWLPIDHFDVHQRNGRREESFIQSVGHFRQHLTSGVAT